ncbi:hypothetical protein [Falsiroseomonas oryzae]|uniref:hypothetical protein n=1 Tax=Falsiroseomonas oryzae TaxID=2766473 RepID=UPI0022EA9949|nr:hypothetical protein [Roseomonas sp. MO-31]
MGELLIHPSYRQKVAAARLAAARAALPRTVPDPTAPARGILFALLLSSLFWATLAILLPLLW